MESCEKRDLSGSRTKVRVLFVPQWYPAKDDQNSVIGTFCREHVRAAALFDSVAVLVFTRRNDPYPTLNWQMIDDGGVPTFYASYGNLPLPKVNLPLFYAQLWHALKKTLVTWGCPDVIHTQDSLAYYVMRAGRRLKIPFVISQHWTGFMERKLDAKTVRRFDWAFSRAQRVLAANQFAAADYGHYGLTAPVSWLPNALDTEIFYPPQTRERELLLLHASGFTPAKRFADIVEGFRQALTAYPRAVLQVAGDGSHRAQMERLAGERLPRSSFRFLGAIAKSELANLMRRARGFVLTSEAETFGCVLMEAMACACPVLTTAVGGIPAVVRTGDGIFAGVGRVDEVARGMIRLLGDSHGLNMDRISRETRQRFSHAAIGDLLHREHVRAAGKLGAPSAALAVA